MPNGRCRFLSKNKELLILCCFKNEKKQKAQLVCNLDKKTIEIRSPNYLILGKRYHMTASIDLNGTGKTKFFCDNSLLKEISYISNHVLDWIIPQRPELMGCDLKVKLRCSKSETIYHLQEYSKSKTIYLSEWANFGRHGNKMHGRCISISSNGYIRIHYRDQDEHGPGNFLNIDTHGTFYSV